MDSSPLDLISQQMSWYGDQARLNRSRYVLCKSTQIIFAATIPVVAVADAGNIQRWSTAVLGALIGILEGLIQLGQYQQNWLLYRATREALRREMFLHSGKAGPYAGVADPDTLFVERSDSIISGENSKWLASEEQASSKTGGTSARTS